MLLPGDDEIRAAAATLGLVLRDEDVPLYREAACARLDEIDAFMHADLDESPPPVRYPDRSGGHRPGRDEDPHNAWLWRCEIRGAAEGCLADRTVSFKDHVAVAGVPLTFGCRALEHVVPDFDATVVTRVLDAGGTVVGKNMLNGFSGLAGPSGEGDFGRPLNPHDADHVTGGSSSGSAAAVSAGEVDVSFGGDQAGSIRIPAAWCGVMGLKPTFALVSHFGIAFGWDQSLDYVGPIARTAGDLAAALQAVAGYDPLDPRQGSETPDRLDVLGGLEHGVEDMRVGVLEEGYDGATEEVGAAVKAALEVFTALGATVERVSVPEHASASSAMRALVPEGHRALFQTGLFGAFDRTYYPGRVGAEVRRLWRTAPEQLNPRTVLNLLVGELGRRAYDGAVYAKAQNARVAFARAYDRALERVDVLVMPTTGAAAPRYEAGTLEATLLSSDFVARNTQPFSYTGHPALTVPCGRAGGLPVGMQLVGRRFDDPLLVRAAHAFEQTAPYEAITAVRPAP